MIQIQIPVNGRSISGYEFYVEESCPDFLITWLSDWLTQYLETGVTLIDGQILQCGWSALQCLIKDDYLRLLAPDFKSMPIEWTSNITNVLYTIMEHQYVPESFGLDLDIPYLQDTAIVGRKFKEFPMFMSRGQRSESNSQDSGWFIGSLREDIDNTEFDNLELMQLYEIVLYAPHVLRYLSMPQGTEIVFESNFPEIFINEQIIKPKIGSYLDKRWLIER